MHRFAVDGTRFRLNKKLIKNNYYPSNKKNYSIGLGNGIYDIESGL